MGGYQHNLLHNLGGVCSDSSDLVCINMISFSFSFFFVFVYCVVMFQYPIWVWCYHLSSIDELNFRSSQLMLWPPYYSLMIHMTPYQPKPNFLSPSIRFIN